MKALPSLLLAHLLVTSLTLNAAEQGHTEPETQAHDSEHQHAAQEAHPHSSHTHGAAELLLVLEQQTLSVELHSPAYNLVGFEHAPETPEQRAQVTQMQQRLAQGGQLLGPDPDASCQLESAETHYPLGTSDAPDYQEIEQHYHFHCERPERLRHLRITLFQHFPNLESLEVQAVTAYNQTTDTLTPSQSELTLPSP